MMRVSRLFPNNKIPHRIDTEIFLGINKFKEYIFLKRNYKLIVFL